MKNNFLFTYIKLGRKFKFFFIDLIIWRWSRRKEEILRAGIAGHKIQIEDLGLSDSAIAKIIFEHNQYHEVDIADIDQDSYYYSHFGPIQEVPTVSKAQYLKRPRIKVKLVSVKKSVGVKKSYGGRKVSFVNELTVLDRLARCGCNVPRIIDIDFNQLTITTNFIQGENLRQRLSEKGAKLLDRDVKDNLSYTNMKKKELWLKRIEEGKRVLYEVVDVDFVRKMFVELKAIHEAGVIVNDIKYGNVIINKRGDPCMFDFDLSSYHPGLTKTFFNILVNQDIVKFNLHYNQKSPT